MNIDKNKSPYGLNYYLNYLLELNKSDKLPNINLISGKKGIGKYSLILKFLGEILNIKDLSDDINFLILKNIYLLQGDNKVKVDDIRNLINFLNKTSFNAQKRFIILNDIELFNKNSLNALLKILENPGHNNVFFLIFNKQYSLLKTIESRCLEIKVKMNNKTRISSIHSLIKDNALTASLDFENSDITPGLFIKFNDIITQNKISEINNYSLKIKKLLEIYKKKKDYSVIQIIKYYSDEYFYKLTKNNKKYIFELNEKKINLFKKLNDFVNLNLSNNYILSEISDFNKWKKIIFI